MSRSNRPSSPRERRPSSAKTARSPSKAAPQSSSRVCLAGSMDRDKRLGTAPLLNCKMSCPAMLSTSINGRSNFRPVSSCGTVRESRSATPAMQRAASRSHLSHSRSDEQASTRTPQCSPDTKSENCSQSESPRSSSKTPHVTVTAEGPSLQNESTVTTQSISEHCTTQSQGADPPSVLTYADCSSPYPQPSHAEITNSKLEEVNVKGWCTAYDHVATCWKLTDGQSHSPKLESRKLDESVSVNEGDLQVCSVADLGSLPPSAGGEASSSEQKNVESNEKATQTSASKRKGSKTHSSKTVPLSAELRINSSPRLDNHLDSGSECSLRSTKSAKSKKSRPHVSRKSHNTHASRRTK